MDIETAEEKIKELLAFAKKHTLAEMTWQDEGVRIAFRRNLTPKAKTPTPTIISRQNGVNKVEVTEKPAIRITSPMVGTFRRSPSKDHPPMVLEGTKVKPGDKVGVVECMKIPNDVVSYSEGTISKILVEDGQPVEYGQPIFELTAAAAAAPKVLVANGRR
jgi:acetyl-CoA carboxylase biotin carboxyl carrier protein